MASGDRVRATLTIRIDSRLHRSLAAVADAERASMNSIAEEALAHEVSRRAANLADTYERLASAMRDRSRPRLTERIDEIAEAEAMPEPLWLSPRGSSASAHRPAPQGPAAAGVPTNIGPPAKGDR